VRHYDLDDIAPLTPFLRDLETALAREMARSLDSPGDAALTVERRPPLERRRQVALCEDRTWRVEQDGSALLLKADVVRFVCPAAGEVNNTLELDLALESRRAGLARLLVLFLFPLAGLLIALFGWTTLQSDSNMEAAPWLTAGALAGFALSLLVVGRLSPVLGALLEGGASLLAPANRRAVLREAAAQLESLAAAHRAQTAAEAATAAKQAPPGDEPAQLAAYTAELVADPDAGIAKYGLLAPANREAVSRAFVRLEKDPKLFRVYRENRKSPAPA
jgi:hypothetical protein